MALGNPSSGERIRAVLGPTNTGKTHLAVERMLAHGTGMIGLPLRLLAREIYDRMVREKGVKACALITGEERIRPDTARYFACTVEAMPLSERADFVAVDEIQLAKDPDRGHVFTDRILHARGNHETMLLGADTMRPALHALDLHVDSERRERFSKLSYVGPTKITKLPKRSAVVAFSSEEVYAIAELLKRQRGGCAVIMGALSPRTRNAQVALYQSGEVDYIVATDAIGMGLNLDVGHIAFASRGKFDGHRRRLLRADEAAQIAGRAGRFRDDGTFGETGDCQPFDEETIQRIENHHFEPVEFLNWRNSDLDWGSVSNLLVSLRRPSSDVLLRRAPEALDELTLAAMAQDEDIRRDVRTPRHVRRLWDLCTLPDFRKHGADARLKLVGMFAEKLIEPDARIKDEWMFEQVERLNRVEGDLDALQQRLAAIRTWTYAANRSDWLENAETWRGRTREIEDKLSDALHERLMQRFVDRRTSALLKTLNAEDDAPAEVDGAGVVGIGGHPIGRLEGLVFRPDVASQTLEGRALRNAAVKSLRPVIERKLAAIGSAESGAFSLRHDSGEIVFDGAAVAKLVPTSDWLSPKVELIGAPDAAAASRERALDRMTAWFDAHRRKVLEPLFRLRDVVEGGGLSGLARGTAFQLIETGAALDRRDPQAVNRPGARAPQATNSSSTHLTLGDKDRADLSVAGVKAGRVAAYVPALLKPGAAQLALALRAIHAGLPAQSAPRHASFALAGAHWPDPMLWAAGYVRLGPRAVRADMAERLSQALSAARKTAGVSAFAAPPELSATIGCPTSEFPGVLRALGLKPAQKDDKGAVVLWRFTSARSPERQGPQRQGREAAQPAPPPSGPFAALAALTQTPPAPQRKRRRRRKPASPAQPTVLAPAEES